MFSEMKALTLQPTLVGEPCQLTAGRSLTSNYVPPCLENKFLKQTPSLVPPLLSSSSLQPSTLTSTSSRLLSTSFMPSSLLSTENKLLKKDASSTLTPSTSFPTTSQPPCLTSRFCHPPSFLGGEQQKPAVLDGGENEISAAEPSNFDQTTWSSTSDDETSEEMEGSWSSLVAPFHVTDEMEEPDQVLVCRSEEFAVLDRGNQEIVNNLKDKKYLFLNMVCCSLVSKNVPPGATKWDAEDSVWTKITNLVKDISESDPQFVLKVAVYTRQELNIRITANFLLALAANLPTTKCHVRRYICAAIQLPSDWLEVVRIYTKCFSPSLPMSLKKGLTDKFKEFNEYQLAKYNTRKHRCKHPGKAAKAKPKPSPEQMKKWAELLRSEPSFLEKYLQSEKRQVVDKKQDQFSLKKMIQRLHIKEPAEHVMAILGRKYPSDVKAFTHSGLKGQWDHERAGQRMKLKEPETWERLLSREGNKAATWERLIDNKSLPFMAMLRNLRNMIMQGISERHHQKIISRLTNKKAVIQSRQFPFRFLSAYKVIMELRRIACEAKQAVPCMSDILTSILKKIPKSRRYRNMEWEKTKKSRKRMTLGVPYVYQMYRVRKAQLIKANQRHYTVELLDRYRAALEVSVQISCRYNIPPLPGRTVILLPSSWVDDEAWLKKLDFCLPPEEEEEDSENEEKGEEEEDSENEEKGEEEEDSENEEKEEEEEDSENEEKGEEEEDSKNEENGEEEEDSKNEEETKEDGEEEEPQNRQSLRRKKKEEERDKLTPSAQEVASLLALMLASCCEDASIFITEWGRQHKVSLKSDVLLENVRSVVKRMTELQNLDSDQSVGEDVFPAKSKVDNVIMLTSTSVSWDLQWLVRKYREDVNKNVLAVTLYLAEWFFGQDSEDDPGMVQLVGFSEQMLRFVAERGSSRLLDHVEHMDKLHNIPPQHGATETAMVANVSIPVSPRVRWRTVRVFISSTFRDMHAERDLLVRFIFPELRRRAATHRLHLQEVELRWGVTEEESARTVEMCLSQVCRSQMMVVILGERYGLVPPRPTLPGRPEYSWLATAPDGLSVTELEIRQFQALHSDSLAERMFCYFRDTELSKSVPASWKADFSSESKEAQFNLNALKNMLRKSDAKVTENYPCQWGGVVEGKPYLEGLEDFGKAVLRDLWAAIVKEFVKEDDEAMSDVLEQEVHQEALQTQCSGRGRQLLAAVDMVQQIQLGGGMMLVEGAQGEGKSVFMAALGTVCSTGVVPTKNFDYDAIFYSATASQSAASAGHMLRYLVRSLRKLQENQDEPPMPLVYRDLLSEFHSTIRNRKDKKPLVLLVDGVDLVVDGHGQMSSEWIPQDLPPNFCLVMSVTSNSALLHTIAKRKGAILFSLGPLPARERMKIVEKQLDDFGKKLSDSAFNNQLQTLVGKKGAVSPLYLRLACEHLKNFSTFDTLTRHLQELPASLGQLVQFSLERLCSQHRAVVGLRWTLAALTVSPSGLRETELYSIVNVCNDLVSGGGAVTWPQVLNLFRKRESRIPMATFTQIAGSLQSLVNPSHCCNVDDLLNLTHPEVKQAFEDFLLPTAADRTRAHLILAGHLWSLADSQGTETFLHCEAASVQQLPASLIDCGQVEVLGLLLSSFFFLYASVRHNLLHQLLQTYSRYDDLAKTSALMSQQQEGLEECRRFLQRHAALLGSWPALFIQQALNEPAESLAHVWAQMMMSSYHMQAVEWTNNERQKGELSTLVSTFTDDPTCLVVSSDGQLMVVGSAQGTLHLVDTHTRQEVKSLVSSCDGVSSCVFLSDGRLAVTSFDGRIEMWDVKSACKTALIEGHSNTITASSCTADRKHLATVSLDFTLKVWSSTKGHEEASWPSTSPLNCVTFDPEDRLLALGCWSGQVIVWNWLQDRTEAILTGHLKSVRCVSFSPSSSSMLCSGSISGEVRLWSVPTSTCVGCFQAHRGSTEALTFLDDGARLLTAGSDCMLQLWSGGLGRSVATMKDEEEQQPPLKKRRSATSEPAALCVAARGEYVAVGYRGKGFRLFSQNSGELLWAPEYLRLTIYSLLWITAPVEETTVELLVTAGADHRLRVWKHDGEAGMSEAGMFSSQVKPIRAMAHSQSYLATGSDDCTVLLWRLSEVVTEECSDPHDQLNGHSGAVTCLTFSPDGAQLLTGGRDQALVIWDVSTTPAELTRTLHHAHRDWITGCVWTPDCVMSSSNDGRILLWNLTEGHQLKELTWSSPLSTICSQGPYVLAGCSDGSLHMWNWETDMEICHIPAHKQRINHCSLLAVDDHPEDMKVATASEDGAVHLWSPMQVEHFSSLLGHSGAVRSVLLKDSAPEFLSISEDCSLRCWTWEAETPPSLQGPVTALCFAPSHGLVLVGFESGLVELWQNSRPVGKKQAADVAVTAMCVLRDGNFAVGYRKPGVDIWRLEWKQGQTAATLLKVDTHKAENGVSHLIHCHTLIGISSLGLIFNVFHGNDDWGNRACGWEKSVRVLDVVRNDAKSIWLMGEDKKNIHVGFLFAMGPPKNLRLSFETVNLLGDDCYDMQKLSETTTAATLDEDFVVRGDMTGNIRTSHTPDFTSWSDKKPAHSDRVSVLRLTKTTVVSGSLDRTVKIWERSTMKQLGMFVCEGPVLVLELNPENPSEMVCGDGLGNVYFLSWRG
ncbi:telomerase protein component 1 isoform X3 [Synchiropus splendidus]|uniref:telomerase protein component 1 isoform X3 n=1 Tax=Synchiropus splendidus TaxID=270530 RepID=UPI00237DC848|nr:telomerase protein component 1 isoform X3 [Synchiropus splendidus]